MASIPSFVRAYLGLLDTAVQAARDLREHAPELPVEVVGNAMQLSLKAQQRFTELAIRGDDVISRFRGAPDEAPTWATFDDEPAARPDPPAPTADDAVASALAGLADREPDPETAPASAVEPRASMVEAVPAKKTPAVKTPAKKPVKSGASMVEVKRPAKKAPAQPVKSGASMVEVKHPAKKTPAKKPVKTGASMVEVKHPAKKTPAKKPVKTGASMVEVKRPAKKTPAKKPVKTGALHGRSPASGQASAGQEGSRSQGPAGAASDSAGHAGRGKRSSPVRVRPDRRPAGHHNR